MTEKTPNYTAEMVARMLEVYQPEAEQDVRDAQIDELAEELGKNRRSIIAKLTTLDAYVPKVYQTKKGEPVVKKEVLVAVLESRFGALNGIEKATKAALIKLVDATATEEVEA